MSFNTQLFINGIWTDSRAGGTLPVLNPATGEAIGTVSHAERADLDSALEAARKGFHTWRKISAYERSKTMRKAADLVRARVDAIARTMSTEQGKPLIEAKGETMLAADLIDWFAEESRRTYGRVIPARRLLRGTCARVRRRGRRSRRGEPRFRRACVHLRIPDPAPGYP